MIVTVRAHRQYSQEQLKGIQGGKILFQPENRDPAAGIMLGLSYVRKRGPQSTGVVFPADPFIFPEQRFVQIVKNMLDATEELCDRLIVLGVPPETVKSDYGLVERSFHLGWAGASRIHSVAKFSEKPSRDLNVRMISNGACSILIPED